MAGPIRISVLADTGLATRSVKNFARATERAVEDATDSLERGSDRAGRGTSGFVSRITAGLSALGPAIMPILGAVAVAGGGVLGAGIAAAAVAAVPLALGGGVLAAGIMAAARDPAVGAAFAPLKEQASAALAKFAEPFKGPLIRAAETFGNALAKATPYLVQMGEAVAPIIDQLAPALAEMAVSALPGILEAVKASVPLFTGLISALPSVSAGLSAVLSGIVAALPYAKAFGLVLFGAGKWIADVLIPPLRTLATQWLRAARNAVVEVTAAFRQNEPQLRAFVGWVTTIVKWVGGSLAPVLGSVLVGNIRLATGAIKGVIAVISAFVAGVRGAINIGKDLASWFQSLPGRIKGWFSGAGSWLKGIGTSIIDGLVSGLRAGFDRVRSTLGELTGMLPSWKGPARRDATLLTKNGQLVIGGFLDGLESRYGAVRRSLGGLTDSLGATATVGASSGTITRSTSSVQAQQALQITFERSGDLLIDTFMELLSDRIRVRHAGNVQSALGSR